MKKVFIAGGAGFIGSHFIDRLLPQANISNIAVYDNFSSGQNWHLAHHASNSKLKIIKGEITNLNQLKEAMVGCDTVIHLASNPDIARAVKEPSIDFDQGTILTQNILEAMRVNNVQRILYASGSGIYGDTGELEIKENYGPLIPISTYGASKLAGEALISAYAYMFDMTGVAFRFGNVVGPRQTHGVAYDFIHKLKENPHELTILGDGQQSKSYVYIEDIINAVLLANEKCKDHFTAFNVATGDYITVNEIAKIVIEKTIGDNSKIKINHTGGDRGWKGDVPVIRLNTDKIRALGWQNKYNCAQAIEKSVEEMLAAILKPTAK